MRTGDLPLPHGNPRVSGQRGFGYLLVLFALAALGLLLAGAGQVWQTTAQREKEVELLFIGNQFRQAIASYYEHSPDAAKQYPARLDDLLEDKRFPMPRRHLRKHYRDPMTGSMDWGLIKAGGRIVGVHSRSGDKPLRQSFDGRDASFSGAARYDQWVFGRAGT
ncbi:MAG: type II secretion system protein [Gallionella sp.]|nr:type II secretion system protein [Gallionella sp.]